MGGTAVDKIFTAILYLYFPVISPGKKLEEGKFHLQLSISASNREDEFKYIFKEAILCFI